MRSDDENPRKSAYRKYLRYSQAGLQFFAAVALFTLGGVWLDKRFGTKVLFTLVGLGVGFAAGFRALYLDLYGRKRPHDSGGDNGAGGGGERDRDLQ